MPLHRSIALLFVFILCVQTLAQDAPPVGATDRWLQSLRDEVATLRPTEEQQAKLDAIYKDATAQASAIAKEPQQGRAAKTAAFRSATHRQVMTVLTEEQKQSLRVYRGKRAAQIFIASIRLQLKPVELTEDQKAKAEEILSSAEKKMAEVISKPVGEGDTGIGRPDPAALAAVVQDLNTRLNALLTPEQRQKLNQPAGAGEGGQKRSE